MSGTYRDSNALANLTIVDWNGGACNSVSITLNGQSTDSSDLKIYEVDGTLHVEGLSSITRKGAFAGNLVLEFA